MRHTVRIGVVVLLAMVISASALVATAAQAGASTVRGFNGKTITVAGLWDTATFPGAQVGAQAYFSALNKTNYLKGVKINFATYVNDAQDPATALTAVRQLVTQQQVFAIVPDMSAVNPGSYLKSQQVPYVGGGFDDTFCSTTPTTSLWGYSYEGCVVSSNPPVVPDNYGSLYDYVKSLTGSLHPTFALFSNDNASGSDSAKFTTIAAKGAGFKVVYAKANLPVTVSDYTPYVQQLMTSNDGKQPQVIICTATAQCIPMWSALKNVGYKGVYWTPLGYISSIASLMMGTVSVAFYNTQPNAGLTAMAAALNAVAPGTKPVGYSNVLAYFSASMFAAAVHAVQAKKQAITPQNVQKALSTITWTIPNLVGPIKYPASTVVQTPYCSELVNSGTGKVLSPYSCSTKYFKVPSG